MQNDVEHDSHEELLRHENLVMRVVQIDDWRTKCEVGMDTKISGLVVYNVALYQ